jgi:hypothetical protein
MLTSNIDNTFFKPATYKIINPILEKYDFSEDKFKNIYNLYGSTNGWRSLYDIRDNKKPV